MKRLVLALLLAPFATASAQVPTVLNVEVDYMVESGGGGHSHRPSASEIAAVVQMFACQGITLNVVVDDAIPHRDVLRRDPLNSSNFFGYLDFDDPAQSFLGIKLAHFDHGSGWHYAVFGHQYEDDRYHVSGSSGLGERPGDDFVVTLGDFTGEIGTAWDRAGTFAHEFGQKIGLNHAGNMDPGGVGTSVPDVPSIMTYFAQLQGVRTALQCNGLIAEEDNETLFKELDYSHGRACSLNEGALAETRGMGIVPVDWNCDGAISGTVAQDVGEQRGGWCGSTAGLDLLSDYDEWSNIVDVAAMPEGSYVSEEVACVTAEEMAAYRAALAARVEGGCPQPTPVQEACTSRRMHYLATGSNPSTGSCSLPFNSLSEALPALGNGNVFYVQPGAYPTTNIVLSAPAQLLGPGGAVFGDN